MSTSDNTSTLKSMYDSAAGTVHSGIASITGSAGDKANAQQAKDKAAVENDLSHSAAKVGPFTMGSSGATAKDSSDRTQGSWDQTFGSGKETLGNLIGNESLKRQGQEQNASGQAQEAKGQLNDLGQGMGDRATGAVGGAFASLTGDRAGQEKYMDLHDEGKARQRGVELDMDKKANA